MASIISRRAFSTSIRRFASDPELTRQSKRNPEVFILGGVVLLALGGAGLYLGRSPTKSTDEEKVKIADMPWERTGASGGKYQYHPGADPNAAPKEAPSAVNVVVVPDVNLPKRLHDKWNKWGKEGY